MNTKKYNNNFSFRSVVKHWNEVSSIYESANNKFSFTHHQRFDEALSHLLINKKSRILNIWSRTGIATKYLRQKEKDIDIVNYEVSPLMVNIARKSFPKETFTVGKFYPIPEKDNSFDIVLSLETLEHVPNPMKFLLELHRVLKPGKRMVLSTPAAAVEYTSVVDDLFKVGHGEGPHKFLSTKKVKTMLREAGFKLITHKSTLFIFLGPTWLIKFSLKYIEPLIQRTFLKEFCIRQFYVCEKRK